MERPGTTVDRAAADVVQDRRPAQAWPQSGGLGCLKGSWGHCFLSNTLPSEKVNIVWHLEPPFHETVMLLLPRRSGLPPASIRSSHPAKSSRRQPARSCALCCLCQSIPKKPPSWQARAVDLMISPAARPWNLQHAAAPTLCIAVVEEADMDTSSEISLTALSRSSQRPLMRGAAPVAVGEDITAGELRKELH